MTVQALLEELRARDIWVWADGSRLQCSTPAGVPQSEVGDLLRQRKNEILEFLRGPAELSFSQQRLWLLEQIAPGGSAYVVAGALELRGALDAPALERALAALVNRHDALRTVFVSVEGEPRQRVCEPGPWSLPVVDLSAQAHPRERLEGLLREEAGRGFDLARGPLFRAQLYRLAPQTHVLMLAMHHIIADGWSMGVLFRELGELYGAFARGEQVSLPALRVQYRDFARWQRGWLRGEALQGLLSHWRERLAGAPQVLELPSDRARPAVESFRGAHYSFALPRELVERLQELARREGATLFMTLLAGLALLLARYSSQQDLLIGTPVANRNRAEIEGLVGFFVNTLVLRADTSGEPSVREFMGRMREACLDAYAHQDLPFERLVEELHPTRDPSRNPVFQVMFALQNAPKGGLELPGLTLAPVEVEHRVARVDLTLLAQETAEGLSGSFEYATDLFDASTIARMAAHWRALLEAMVATPERHVDELPLLTNAERRKLLEEWNDTKVEYPVDVLMHELVEAQAERTPERVAVVHEEGELTYGELNARANRLAHYLRSLGVKPDARVAICVERGIEMVVGLLAVLKAGGAYVPLDPAYPAERLSYMVQDSTPVAILTDARVPAAVQAELRSVVGAEAIPLIDLQAAADAWAKQPATNPEPSAVGLGSAHLAYVIYTSGSTGKPKGVAIEHRNAVNFLYWAKASFSPEQLSQTLFSTSLNFDLAMYECFAPLVVGATTHVVRNALELAQAPRRVTLINTVPSAISALLDAGGVPQTVRTVNLAGEPLKRALVERLFAQTRVDTVCNLYGPSETTTYSTWVAMRREDGFAAHIGRPLANTRIYLLDAHGQPVPLGVVGELYIGGAGVARGYLNRPELTAERFLPDPFAKEPDARMYKTGDLARYLADGNIEFLGRNDFQVKIRGYRIELGEIEAALSQHPAVREAVVLAREDSPGDKRLVAYVAAPQAPDDLVEQLRAHIRTTLPEYMLPAVFVTLEALPLTPNGKVDRKALPAPDGAAYASRGYEAPVGEVEAKLAQIWAEVLKLERIGRHDNFFELGGHSLLAVTLIERMRRAGLNADVRVLFSTPTLAGFAAATEDIEVVL